eukprot:7206884-Alexandrium_andersonii.AAC.1
MCNSHPQARPQNVFDSQIWEHPIRNSTRWRAEGPRFDSHSQRDSAHQRVQHLRTGTVGKRALATRG